MVTHIRHIPEWDSSGFLPPYTGGRLQPSSHPPYLVSLTDLVQRFGSTDRRRAILAGFLEYRAALHNAGLVRGFQWVNGGFITDTTGTGNSEPSDINVVTFYNLPTGYTQESLAAEFPAPLNDHDVREKYHTDATMICLDTDGMFYLLKLAAYWNAIWSHTAEDRRKGYLVISLFNDMDEVARKCCWANKRNKYEVSAMNRK